jgi:ABC-type transporter Mla subunit MlaD
MKVASTSALVALLALSGCGGATNAFAEDYNRAVRPLAELGAKVGASASDFDRLARRTRETRRNLARLDPPEGASDELAALLRRLDRASRDLGSVADAARSKDPVRQARAAERLEQSTEELHEAEDALKGAVAEAG